MILGDISKEKEMINYIISQGLNEILKGKLLASASDENLRAIEQDIFSLMDALVTKNKIFDYGFKIEFDHIINKFMGTIAYSLIDTSNITDEKELVKFEEIIEFSF